LGLGCRRRARTVSPVLYIARMRAGRLATPLALPAGAMLMLICLVTGAAATTYPPPPSPPSAPPLYVTCGCQRVLDGADTAADALCIKKEGPLTVCRHAPAVHDGNANQGARCPGDMAICETTGGTYSTPRACNDEPGIWANKKCARKLRKGKCHKKRPQKKCAKTCAGCA